MGRRKTKNISAILAVTLGVTLLVGIQITTDTLKNSFLTSLLQGEGEVDIRVSNATAGAKLTAAEEEKISTLVPNAVGIMPELSTQIPVNVGSQFDPAVEAAGINTAFPEVFGSFYDWKTGEKMNLADFLADNSSILISSSLAENLGLDKETPFPVTLKTEFTNVTISIVNDTVTGLPTAIPAYSTANVELSIVGVFDSNRPGIGSQYTGVIFALEHLQDWLSLQDPMREKDQISTYLIALKTNHFTTEISEDYLKEQVDTLKNATPEQTNPLTNGSLTPPIPISKNYIISNFQ